MQATSGSGTKSTNSSGVMRLSIFFLNRFNGNLPGNDPITQATSASTPHLESQGFHHPLKGYNVGLLQRPGDVHALGLAI